ncbi:MAG: restriction endonuclease subunit S [Nitrospira sp.]|nr:restriction endonuclease subunit S [Nitrospira sp.]MBH0182547.1 restriction endonuclease subunit S [Nitrospira sp.]MBH0185535.1 restriction endonuclease subunit S [Nitrospira sp.]
MNVSWQPAKLAQVLTPVSRAEAVDPTKEYRLLGIRLDGAGPFLRETVAGSQSAATRLFKVEEGDFIYSRLFAWRGAFGVIGSELDGCYVSGEFPTFKPNTEKIDIEFLRLWFHLPTTLERVEADCSGSTPLTRNRFKENFFLDLEISLPPLTKQRWIVARIESLAAKVEEARALRGQAVEGAELFCVRAIHRFSIARSGTSNGWNPFSLNRLETDLLHSQKLNRVADRCSASTRYLVRPAVSSISQPTKQLR